MVINPPETGTMKNPGYQDWLERAWRGDLPSGERAGIQAFLEAHPECRAEWESESRLNAALDSLPAVPVSSNFTARVVRASQWEQEREANREPGRLWSWWTDLGWGHRTAMSGGAAVLLLALGLWTHQFSQQRHRVELAEHTARLSRVAALVQPDLSPSNTNLWLNFETIVRMPAASPPPGDLRLLAALEALPWESADPLR
jgi:anti-sigma factor RsiW